ncbi:spore germination protein [Gottfriedia sp. S16(2024)]|uniref:spore germination protein n=1 Tax=Gottfriedia sp. S16(2024) TaxID=3162883 RepID=UPI003D19E457
MDHLNGRNEKNKKNNIHNFTINPKGNINENLEIIESIFPTSDLVKKILMIDEKPALLIYLSGLVNDQKIDSFINNIISQKKDFEIFVNNNTESTIRIPKIEKSILDGKSILFLDGISSAFIYSTENPPHRTFMPPNIDNSLKGSRISFVETYQANIALLRRFIQNKDFRTKQTEIGNENRSIVSIAYLDRVVDENLLLSVENRISEIKVDSVLNANQLAQLMERNQFSPFPQILTTERPDEAASAILKGKVVLILDRSSEVIILPSEFISFFTSIDDYSSRTLVASFNRLLRIVAFIITLYLPGLYIAIVSFNYEVIPLKLLFSIGESRAQVPFDPLFEAIIMEITLEMLREAGIRLPAPISTTVGVVGGIVIGQAAVQAGIVSNIMVIVVALTAISSFIIPKYEMASSLRILRFPIMVMASLFGFFGLIISTMILIVHGLSLKSFNTSYTAPLSPTIFTQLKDTFIRMPLNYLWKNQNKNIKKG